MVTSTGLEPAISGVKARCLDHFDYDAILEGQSPSRFLFHSIGFWADTLTSQAACRLYRKEPNRSGFSLTGHLATHVKRALGLLVGRRGIEPPSFGFSDRRSDLVSYPTPEGGGFGYF